MDDAGIRGWRPPHAYLPGLTPRHDEALFDPVKARLKGRTFDQMLAGPVVPLARDLIAEGFGWEAHELLEPIWMAAPPQSADRFALRALIQEANARVKRDMGRPAAAERLDTAARDLWREARQRGWHG